MLIPFAHHENHPREVLVEKIGVSGSISGLEGNVHDLVGGGLVAVGIFVLGMIK